MTRDQLYEAIVDLCQQYGYTNANTYDKVHELIDTILEDPEEDEPMDMSGSTRGVER